MINFFKKIVFLFAVLTFLSSGLLHAASYESWNKYRKNLLKNDSLIRYYSFDGIQNGKVKNLSNPKGALSILSNSAFGNPRTFLKDGKPIVYPRLAVGRWFNKKALKLSPVRRGVSRSNFYGTKSGSFTFETWIYVYNTAPLQSGSLFWMGPGYKKGWRLEYTKRKWNPTGSIALVAGIPAGSATIRKSKCPQNIWHHLVFSWDNNNKKMSFYVDGKLCGSKTLRQGLKLPKPRRSSINSPENDLDGLMIGGQHFSRGKALDFKIDELVIYKRVLLPAEILKHFQTGCPDGEFVERRKKNLEDEITEKAIAKIRMEVPVSSYGYFPKGQNITINIKFPVHDWRNPPVEILLRTVDASGHVIVKKSIRIPLKELSSFQSTLQVKLDKSGLYWLKLKVIDSGKLVMKQETIPVGIVSVLPGKTERLGAQDLTASQPECLALGVGISRIVCHWGQIEKAKNEFEWSFLDKLIEHNISNGIETVLCFTGFPKWMKVSIKSPIDMEKYRNIISLLVNRYKGQIKYWEIWNEPNSSSMRRKNKVNDYIQLLKNAYAVIHVEDSQSKVIGICARKASRTWLKALISKGALKHLDIASLHLHAPVTTLYQSKKSSIRAFRKILDERGGKTIPLWNTDGGHRQPSRLEDRPLREKEMLRTYTGRKAFAGTEAYIKIWNIPMVSENKGAAWLVKDILLQMADGIDKYFFNPGPSRYYPSYNNSDGNPSLKGIACATLASMIISAKKISRINSLPSKVKGVSIDSNAVLFTTDKNRKEIVLKVPKADMVFKGMDMFGNPLTWKSNKKSELKLKLSREPVYISGFSFAKKN